MSILRVLHFPDERLREKAEPVSQVDDSIRAVVENMLKTMYAEKGIGLAAIQVDIKKQILVLDISENRDAPQIFINPNIIFHEGEQISEEGCLSVPEAWAPVPRYAKIKIAALNEKGNTIIQEAEGLLSRCLQHEIDHLNGRLFIDYLSAFKRNRIVKKLEKLCKFNRGSIES